MCKLYQCSLFKLLYNTIVHFQFMPDTNGSCTESDSNDNNNHG